MVKLTSGFECVFTNKCKQLRIPYFNFTSETKLWKQKHVNDDNRLVSMWWVTYYCYKQNIMARIPVSGENLGGGVIFAVFIYFVHPRHSHRAQGVILPILRVNRASPLSIVYAACQNVWITKGKQKIQEFSKLSVYILFCSKREKPNFFQIPKV